MSDVIKAAPLTRRSSDVILVANVYLIPADLTTDSITNIKQVKIVLGLNHFDFLFYVAC